MGGISIPTEKKSLTPKIKEDIPKEPRLSSSSSMSGDDKNAFHEQKDNELEGELSLNDPVCEEIIVEKRVESLDMATTMESEIIISEETSIAFEEEGIVVK